MSESKNISDWDRQVDGTHYRDVEGEQLWDRIWRLCGPDAAYAFFTGNIVRYLERYRKKDGLKDLYKARHYLNKLISLEEQNLAATRMHYCDMKDELQRRCLCGNEAGPSTSILDSVTCSACLSLMRVGGRAKAPAPSTDKQET
jgi:hypothetical protein